MMFWKLNGKGRERGKRGGGTDTKTMQLSANGTWSNAALDAIMGERL